MTDFEKGLRKALSEVYPKTILSGCWFHFRKALLRKIRLYGISKLWNKKARSNNPEKASRAKRIYLMCGMLALLPAKDFTPGYHYIQNEAVKFKLCDAFSKFFDYFNRTWVVEVGKNVNYSF